MTEKVKYDLYYWKGDGAKQLEYLILWHQDVAQQAKVYRRVSEQTLEEMTVKALECLRDEKKD
jgi:hypothetical protein